LAQLEESISGPYDPRFPANIPTPTLFNYVHFVAWPVFFFLFWGLLSEFSCWNSRLRPFCWSHSSQIFITVFFWYDNSKADY